MVKRDADQCRVPFNLLETLTTDCWSQTHAYSGPNFLHHESFVSRQKFRTSSAFVWLKSCTTNNTDYATKIVLFMTKVRQRKSRYMGLKSMQHWHSGLTRQCCGIIQLNLLTQAYHYSNRLSLCSQFPVEIFPSSLFKTPVTAFSDIV